MDRIAHRDLRNQSAEILRRVARGESFEITNHGQVVAVIRPPSADDVWEAVVERPATVSGAWADLPRHRATAAAPHDVLDDLRGERTIGLSTLAPA